MQPFAQFHSNNEYNMCGQYVPTYGQYAPMYGQQAHMYGQYAPVYGQYAPSDSASQPKRLESSSDSVTETTAAEKPMCATTCFRTETRVNPQRSTRRQAVHMRQCSTLLSS